MIPWGPGRPLTGKAEGLGADGFKSEARKKKVAKVLGENVAVGGKDQKGKG